MNQEISQNVQKALRSLYRYAEFYKMKSPDIIIEMEKSILTKYLSVLTSEDILTLATNFNSYYENQQIQSALEDEYLAADFTRYLNGLN